MQKEGEDTTHWPTYEGASCETKTPTYISFQSRAEELLVMHQEAVNCNKRPFFSSLKNNNNRTFKRYSERHSENRVKVLTSSSHVLCIIEWKRCCSQKIVDQGPCLLRLQVDQRMRNLREHNFAVFFVSWVSNRKSLGQRELKTKQKANKQNFN